MTSNLSASRLLLFLFATATPGLIAQDQPGGQSPAASLGERSFFPTEYAGEAFVDFAALREAEIWDGIERSVLRMFLGMFEDEFGFSMDQLDRIRTVPGEYLEDGGRYRGSVTVLVGNEDVGIPTFGQSRTEVEETAIGGRTVVLEKQSWAPGGGQVYHSPRDGLVIYGDEYLMRPVLEGKRKAGVPGGELLAITSGRGNLAYFAMAVTKADVSSFGVELEDVWVEQDPITFALARLRQTADGERVVVEATTRFRTGDQGRPKLEKLLRDGLETAKNHPRLGALKRYWNAIKIHSEGAELRATLDLGTPRQAAGVIPMLLAPMVLMGTTDAAPAAVPVAEPGALEPAAEPASRPSGKAGEPKKGGPKPTSRPGGKKNTG